MQESKKTYWKDSCQESTEILNQLQCEEEINKQTCLNLTTQSQLCQYQEGKCQNYSKKLDSDCKSIIQINNGIICQLHTGQPCKFDSNLFQCQEANDNPDLNCNERAQQFFNKQACESNKDCIFIDKCQQYDQNNLYYCNQANSIENCKNVQLEGCYRNAQQKCEVIKDEIKRSINCSQVENKVGCLQLETQGQYCRYYDNKCQSENILDYRIKKCTDIILINKQQFCEQTRDIQCINDPLNHSCIQLKQEIQDLTCPRGLNKLILQLLLWLKFRHLRLQFRGYLMLLKSQNN